jgi:hypothetical protein
MILALLACTAEEPLPAQEVVALLARASLDLRGVRPSEEEVAAVLADAEALDGFVAAWFHDPRWEERVTAQYLDVLGTRSESFLLFEREAIDDPQRFLDAIGQEAPRLVGRIAALDLPYSALVTTDWTMIDDALAAHYPTDYPPGERGWRVARYTDHRPAAGVLSTNGLWWRYTTTDANVNRRRANQVSRVFACSDFLQADVPFDPSIDLLDEDAVENAIATNPGCVACHRSLDPIASNLYGFWYFYDDGYHLSDTVRYHPERERDWVDRTGIPPAWFGRPSAGLGTLPAAIVADDRFAPCAVRHAYRFLVGEDLADPDPLMPTFRAGGGTVRAAWQAVLDDPAWAATPKLAGPTLVASMVEALTSYRWTLEAGGGRDALTTEVDGFLTLAGGADGATVTTPLGTPSTTAALVQDRLAESAAAHVVAAESGRGERALFRELDPANAGTEEERRELVRGLFVRVHTRVVEPGDPEVDALLALWDDAFALTGRADQAWMAVVAVMLRSPDLVIY